MALSKWRLNNNRCHVWNKTTPSKQIIDRALICVVLCRYAQTFGATSGVKMDIFVYYAERTSVILSRLLSAYGSEWTGGRSWLGNSPGRPSPCDELPFTRTIHIGGSIFGTTSTTSTANYYKTLKILGYLFGFIDEILRIYFLFCFLLAE